MLFNSLSFAVFFPVVVISYFALPARLRPSLLLTASCLFYMAFVPSYILILFALITLDYFLAQLIARCEGRRRLVLLVLSIVANLGMLFFFKYFNFFNNNVAALADFLNWNYSPLLLTIALPLGLSFHIFQSMSYVIEVYKKRFAPERNYLIYSLYVMFFPQLVAGPIERPAHLLPQLRAPQAFDAHRVRQGLERMLWGFFKKLVIADNIAPFVDSIYSSPTAEGPLIALAAVLFAFQIYCDFSGYSDIALGSAKVLGYEIMENFNRPFASRTVAEFWRRWHISLSSWLRDYVYYPLALGGKRHTVSRLYASLFISFVLIGLWHGANWTYVIFGALNGMYVTVGSFTAAIRERLARMSGLAGAPTLHHIIQVIITFALFAFCLIFFRAENVHQAWQFVTGLLSDSWVTLPEWLRTLATLEKVRLLVVVGSIVLMEIVQYAQSKRGTFFIFDVLPRYIRFCWYYVIITAILLFGYFQAQPFIYFQF